MFRAQVAARTDGLKPDSDQSAGDISEAHRRMFRLFIGFQSPGTRKGNQQDRRKISAYILGCGLHLRQIVALEQLSHHSNTEDTVIWISPLKTDCSASLLQTSEDTSTHNLLIAKYP